LSSITEIAQKTVSELTQEDIQALLEFVNRVIGNIPEYYGFDEILKRLLASVPDTEDKRVGAIIYDALAPTAGEMANEYIEINIFRDQVYLLTAIGSNLDKIGENYSMPRKPATYAERIAEFIDTNDAPKNLPIGSRFAVPDSDSAITYRITSFIEVGKAVVTCEQIGTVGNEYSGDILPLFTINDLKIARIIGVQTPAQDVEDDETYRERIIDYLNHKGFGGNIRDYEEYIDKINGTSKPKVFPVWNGGGTVKVSVLDSQYNAISAEFQAQIKELLDPEDYSGEGVGMAPIGHHVTISTPTEVTVDISATLDLDTVTIGQVQAEIEANLEEYFYSIRKSWQKNKFTSVYIAQVIANMVKVNGVKNATDVLLNEEDSDINLENTAIEQFIPVLGEVTLSEQS